MKKRKKQSRTSRPQQVRIYCRSCGLIWNSLILQSRTETMGGKRSEGCDVQFYSFDKALCGVVRGWHISVLSPPPSALSGRCDLCTVPTAPCPRLFRPPRLPRSPLPPPTPRLPRSLLPPPLTPRPHAVITVTELEAINAQHPAPTPRDNSEGMGFDPRTVPIPLSPGRACWRVLSDLRQLK